MKAEIELARAREERTTELAAEARYARERFDLYKAKTNGPRMTSPARLRELERRCELVEARLRLIQTSPPTPPDTEAEPNGGSGVPGKTQLGPN